MKPLLSRKFCKKCVRENSRDFHTVVNKEVLIPFNSSNFKENISSYLNFSSFGRYNPCTNSHVEFAFWHWFNPDVISLKMWKKSWKLAAQFLSLNNFIIHWKSSSPRHLLTFSLFYLDCAHIDDFSNFSYLLQSVSRNKP